MKGKNPSNCVVPWGERVLYMPPKATKIEEVVGKKHAKTKDDFRYEVGVFLGIKGDSNESWIGTSKGEVAFARSLRRMTDEDKWALEDVENVQGLPWDLKGERKGERI